MLAPAPKPTRPVADKRAAILAAALRLIARSGLHDTPVAAVAQEAGVGAGTVYRYFPSKEAMINALYLELLEEQGWAAPESADWTREEEADARETLWRAWHALARWHVDRPEASNVMHQCRASGILTAETREIEQRAKAAGLARFEEGIERGLIRRLPLRTFLALFLGPISGMVEMRGASESEVTDAELRATFDGVCRSVLP
jgi:TetR/AcrR family transcriptional regulator, repressor of fatR-cypB operon